mmetsp:Transcript_7866/g.15196  ORF Transcript_7866/g.15196 Transcript_7866/m.15196 type:complete len:1261 (-) Transcript_7866:519-4301(-)
MIALLSFALTSYAAQTDYLLKTLVISQDSVPETLWPEFRPWDAAPLYYQNVLQGHEALTLKVEAFMSDAVTAWRLGTAAWNSFEGEVSISGLEEGLNSLNVMVEWKSSQFTYTVFLRRTTESNLTGMHLKAGETDLACSPDFHTAQLNYECSPEVSQPSDITITPAAFAGTILEYRHISLLDRDSAWRTLPLAGAKVSSFLNHTMEHMLQIKATSTHSVLYLFMIRVSPAPYKPTSMTYTFDSSTVPAIYDWDLNPRFHPDILTYTLVPSLSNKANLHTKWKFEAPQACPVYLYPSSGAWAYYLFETGDWSNTFKIQPGKDVIKVEFKPDGGEVVQYAFNLYTMSSNVNLMSLSFFANPLVQQTGAQVASNSSEVAEGFTYAYDGRQLDEYSKFGMGVGLRSLPYKEVFYAIRTKWTLEPIQYTSDIADGGLLSLVKPEANTTLVQVRLNDRAIETEYLKSFKTFGPLSIGENTLEVKLTPEEPDYNKTLRVNMRLLDPDARLRSLELPSSISLTPNFASVHTVYRVMIPLNVTSVEIVAEAEHANATVQVVTSYSVSIVSDDSLLSCIVDVPEEVVSGISIQLRVVAESTNVSRDIWLYIERQDVCGNGRRWNSIEVCDDGNSLAGDGCSFCKVDLNWTCSGGTSTSPDKCSRLATPEDPSPNSPNRTEEVPKPANDPPQYPNPSTPTTPTPPEPQNITEVSNEPIVHIPTCGDQQVDTGEECDDGNSNNNDGCSALCMTESNGLVCGDGLRLPEPITGYHEECDDGNRIAGDGCSITCYIEEGWVCTNSSIVTLPTSVRRPDSCSLHHSIVHVEDDEGVTETEGLWFPWLELISQVVVASMTLVSFASQVYKERRGVKSDLNNPMLYVIDLLGLLQILSMASSHFGSQDQAYSLLESLKWTRFNVPYFPIGNELMKETVQFPALMCAALVCSIAVSSAQKHWPGLRLLRKFFVLRSFIYIYFCLHSAVLGSLLQNIDDSDSLSYGIGYAAGIVFIEAGGVLALVLHRLILSVKAIKKCLRAIYEGVKENSAVVEPVIKGTARRLSRLFVNLPPKMLRRHFSSYEEPEDHLDRSFEVNKKQIPPFLSTPLDHKYSEVTSVQVSQFDANDELQSKSLSRYWVYYLIRLTSNSCFVVAAVQCQGFTLLAPVILSTSIVWLFVLAFSPLSNYNYSLTQCLSRLWVSTAFVMIAIKESLPDNILPYLLLTLTLALLATFSLSFTIEQVSLYKAPLKVRAKSAEVVPSLEKQQEANSVTVSNLA